MTTKASPRTPRSTDKTAEDQRGEATRLRILRAALEEFSTRGYHATSIREIAEQVGITKTAVLYHFPGKEELLGALAAPMLAALDACLLAAALAGPGESRWVALEGMLEVWLAHRYLLRLSMDDLALAASGPIFKRFRDAMFRANDLVAGPNPDLSERVRASQAIAMLSDPVVFLAEAETPLLRANVLAGVRRLYGIGETGAGVPRHPDARSAALPSTRSASRSRRQGRPSVVSSEMAETVRRMHDAGNTAAEIADAVGVSRATVYRHLGERPSERE